MRHTTNITFSKGSLNYCEWNVYGVTKNVHRLYQRHFECYVNPKDDNIWKQSNDVNCCTCSSFSVGLNPLSRENFLATNSTHCVNGGNPPSTCKSFRRVLGLFPPDEKETYRTLICQSVEAVPPQGNPSNVNRRARGIDWEVSIFQCRG